MRGDHFINSRNDRLNRLVRIDRKWHDILRNDLAAEIGHRDRSLRRMNVERDDSPLMIELEERRSAPPRQPPRRPLKDPLVLDEIFDDQRYRAALQARNSGKICPRQWLVGANYIEDEISIDQAWRLVRCALAASKREPRRGCRRHG